jgi:hypothetical protein
MRRAPDSAANQAPQLLPMRLRGREGGVHVLQCCAGVALRFCRRAAAATCIESMVVTEMPESEFSTLKRFTREFQYQIDEERQRVRARRLSPPMTKAGSTYHFHWYFSLRRKPQEDTISSP